MSSGSFDYMQLPAKMVLEPQPQAVGQSMEDYLYYYDTVVSANVWDDLTAALYLPRLITDPRFKHYIEQLLPEQRKSYRWLKQTLLEAAKYRPPPPPSSSQNTGPSLCEKYWTKIGDLRTHIHGDLNHLCNEVHGLMGETYDHLSTRMVDGQRLVQSVVPPVLGKTVFNAMNKLASSARPSSAPRTAPPPPNTPPAYQDIYGDGKF